MNTHDLDARRNRVSWSGVALAAFVSLAAAADLDAQTAASQEPRFEVVAIKRSSGGGVGSMMAVRPGGRVSVRNLPVQEVIRRAYGILPFQLTGGSDWLQGERYDIEAKAPDGAVVTADAINLMLRAMLSDRFKLKVRRETRESAIYELVLARTDRRFGEKLRETSADCVAQRNRGTESGGSLPDAARVRGEDPIPCGMVMSGGNRIAAGGETMTKFATMLVPLVQRIVVDNTGLTGVYDFDLQFLPDQGYVRGLPVRMYLVAADVPPLLTAIQEQLGLKLQPARGPVEYVVIESIARPSED
jgi:uncharacterized protein (TIGR03435 family)